jgi:hypothetical protein
MYVCLSATCLVEGARLVLIERDAVLELPQHVLLLCGCGWLWLWLEGKGVVYACVCTCLRVGAGRLSIYSIHAYMHLVLGGERMARQKSAVVLDDERLEEVDL